MKTAFAIFAMLPAASTLLADPLHCDLAQYQIVRGLTASVADNTLVVTWDGDRDVELRVRFAIDGGTPTIRELATRRKSGSWNAVLTNATPEFRVVSGLRRITGQQLKAVRGLNIPITEEILQREQWKAFWDAPLYIEGSGVRPPTHAGAIPPLEGILSQPGLPRKPEEANRATATYHALGCAVKTDGARLEISFPGVEVGVFSGRLEYSIYRGTNLIRQAVIAKTDRPSVAYKYDAGIKGVTIQSTSRVAWRDLANTWQEYQFGGANNPVPMILKAANRVVFAEGSGGSIAAFPPPAYLLRST